MKRISLILTTLGLFAFSIYLAFLQGGSPAIESQETLEGTLRAAAFSPVVYTGFKAQVANIFAVIFNSLMQIMGNSVLLSIIALGLLVELLLLYPSVRIQLKQKKIHLFHKKLVDRFNSGELSVSKTEDELYKLYDVNEKMHHRGAVLVVIQIALFFFTFWGLNLMVKAPGLLSGSWNILNFSMLSVTSHYLIPLLAGGGLEVSPETSKILINCGLVHQFSAKYYRGSFRDYRRNTCLPFCRHFCRSLSALFCYIDGIFHHSLHYCGTARERLGEVRATGTYPDAA